MKDIQSPDLLETFHLDLLQAGILARLLEASEELAIPTLLVEIPPDEDKKERWLSLTVIPADEMMEEVDLVQFYLPLFSLEEASRSQVALHDINEKIVMGHAGLQADGLVYLRYTWAIPKGMPILHTVLLEVIQLFTFSASFAKRLISG